MRALLIVMIGLWSQANFAQQDELSFDQFIRQFDENRYRVKKKSSDPFENIYMHAGLGYISSLVNVQLPVVYPQTVIKDVAGDIIDESEAYDENGELLEGYKKVTEYISTEDKFQSFQSGVQLSVGIDLFSSFWAAEGTFRNFNESEANGRRVDLNEFDLKVVYQKLLKDTLGYRAGAGLGARYISIESKLPPYKKEFSSPSSVIFFGLESHVSESLSLGAEFASRNSMLTEAPDKSSFDLTLRVDTHF